MRFLIIPTPFGPWKNAEGKLFRCLALPDQARVAGPIQPVVADSEAAAAGQAALTAVTPSVDAAKKARLAALLAQLKSDLLGVFGSWTVGEQYDFEGARQALNADLLKGDLARAITGVQTFRPADTTLQAHREQVLGVLQTGATHFAAVTAATTLEGVAAA